MRRTPSSTSAAPPTTSPVPTRPGTEWPVSSKRGCKRWLGGGFRRALQLDGVAVGVGDVDRRAVAFGAVASANFAWVDAVLPQMRRHCGDIHLFDANREMVH